MATKKQIVAAARKIIGKRSAWARGVCEYADDLIEEVPAGFFRERKTHSELIRSLLNGAEDFQQYSSGGCSLCYNHQIVERLCTPSEKKRADSFGSEVFEWQGRALYQAAEAIYRAQNELHGYQG